MNRIICLAGDGIGPEIMQSGLKVLEYATKDTDFKYEIVKSEFGGASIDLNGVPFTDDLKEKLGEADAILLGAIGGPKWDKATIRPEQGLLALRKFLNLYANIRPLKTNAALISKSPLKEEIIAGTDLVVVRELSSGIYFGEPRHKGDDEAYDTMRYTKEEIKKIAKYAFEVASNRTKRLVSVDKANVLASSKLWRSVVEEVALDYPEVVLEHRYVDAMAMELVTNPSKYDVVLCSNLFGDILSDEVSVLGGSLGVLASASFSESGVSLYEPAHGSAPDIAGQDIANPIAMIYSISMMLRYSFNQFDIADKIDKAVDRTLELGYFTKDLNENQYLGTSKWSDKLIELMTDTK